MPVECVFVWAEFRVPLCVLVPHPVPGGGGSRSLLLLPSPASASRTEACKDMHAFYFNVSGGGISVKSACVD